MCNLGPGHAKFLEMSDGQHPFDVAIAVPPLAVGVARHPCCHILGRTQIDQFSVDRATPLPVGELDYRPNEEPFLVTVVPIDGSHCC